MMHQPVDDCKDPSSNFEQLVGIFNRGVVDYFGSGDGIAVPPEAATAAATTECLVNATLVIRLLYDLAVDAYDRCQQTSLQLAGKTSSVNKMATTSTTTTTTRDRHLSLADSVAVSPTHHSASSGGSQQQQQYPMLVHPGVILALFQLIPSASGSCAPLQQLITDVIQSLLVHSERNVQILCDANFPAEMLKRASSAVVQLEPLTAIWEHLGRQALEAKDLREFLRMGDPLNCLLPDATNGGGGRGHPLPLSRLRSLVSMSSAIPPIPSIHHHRGGGSSSLSAPPFVEFDMQPEGFGCLFLPSVAPQCIVGGGGGGSVGSVPSMATTMTGGDGGGGDMIFPAPTRMSFSTWICVDLLSDPRLDPHGIRLLTLVRTVDERESNAAAAAAASGDDHLICLSVVLSARDKALLVSTQETVLPKGSSDWEPEVSGDFGARIWNPGKIN